MIRHMQTSECHLALIESAKILSLLGMATSAYKSIPIPNHHKVNQVRFR